MAPPVLIVDDDPVQRRILEAAVVKFGYQAAVADGGEAALSMLERGEYCVVVLDLMMPGIGGLQVLETMGERGLELPVIVQTAKGGIETAVTAMRAGAFDFVVKPISPEKLQTAIANAVKVGTQEGEAKRKRRGAAASLDFRDIITESPAMERVLRMARKAATSGIPILIEGESGVGKELVARAIQSSGERGGKPFVTVNCGAIPDNLVESILFGHEKGSFTGATEKHVGKFVEANGGTLFLDEIGDLPLDVQVKLLRAVQEGEVDPVGGRSTVKVDIRLISATHRDLLQRVREGSFREDLFYRLNVFPIHIPALRERREDIALLVRHFVSRIGRAESSGRVRHISSDALAMLAAYDWPGNIRQLENAIFRAVVLCEGDTLGIEEFPQIRAQIGGFGEVTQPDQVAPASVEASVSAVPVGETTRMLDTVMDAAEMGTGILNALDARGNVRPLSEIEDEMIRLALDHYNGQMSEVARRLGIGRSTLYRKLKELGIDPDLERPDRLAG